MILLDTHVVIWLMTSPERISKNAALAIDQSGARGERALVSSASVYEIGYGARLGRIRLHVAGTGFLDRLGAIFHLRAVTEEIAFRAASFPEPFHGDPIDRMIAATAIVEGCVLLTADNKIRQAGVCQTLW
jgi:PIN domain nuclease of toxin-antitoxin system